MSRTLPTHSALRAARGAAVALALTAAALIAPAYAGSDDQTASANKATGYGSVEGYGGFAGRVGNPDPANPIVAAEPTARAGAGSVEGYGGFAGRVGPPVNTNVATNGAQQAGR